MSVFERRNDTLFVEELPLSTLADEFGTPCYVYSKKAIVDSYRAYADALGTHPGQICYAVKANSNIAVLQVLAEIGSGFDIVSEGELRRVLTAGGDPKKVIFSGVGKTADEMLFALETGIACFNVESDQELKLLSEVAAKHGFVANISLRVNPDVDAQTHPYISTGLKENKFGIDINRAPEVYAVAAGLPAINIVGVDCHIGSQLTETQPFYDALDRLLVLLDTLKEQGIDIDHLDLGGGIGVQYRDETPPNIGEYIGAIKSRLSDHRLALMFEPGRSIVANAGALLTEVLYLKPTEQKNFAVIDAAMNDNIRPALYQAWQNVVPLEAKGSASATEHQMWDLVGPVCETGDFIAKDRDLALDVGDRLAVLSSGAYCFAMSSNYNTRARVAEILVSGDESFEIRRREAFEDLIRGEQLIPQDGKGL